MGSTEIISFLDAIKSLVSALNKLSAGSTGGGTTGSLDAGSLGSLGG
ncbi:hypothetical protein [Rhodococcus sp. SGAir0479]|nr:hypothetical protein [Rhodococcus sp. SGAir0479]